MDEKEKSSFDTVKLALLVKEAKGEERTVTEFANATGISTAQMYRIIGGTIARPLDESKLEAIYNNRCSSCNIKKEDLVKANTKTERNEEMIFLRDVASYERTNVIRGILLKKIYTQFDEIYIHRPSLSTRHCDLELYGIRFPNFMVTAKMGQTSVKWFFEGVFQDKEQHHIDEDEYVKKYCAHHIRRFAYLFFDSSVGKLDANIRFSLVCGEREIYDSFVESFSCAKYHNYLSIILIDSKKEKIVDEYIFDTF